MRNRGGFLYGVPMANVYETGLRERQAAQWLALGHDPKRICRQLNISLPALRKMEQQESFKSAVDEFTNRAAEFQEMQASAMELLAPKAIQRLEEIMLNPNTKDGDALRAIDTILRKALPDPKENKNEIKAQINVISEKAAVGLQESISGLLANRGEERPVYDLESSPHVQHPKDRE